ncbi:MAG: hypothetical protein KA752_07225 [Giesbergeria sp.]|nr:hypothetical protein [Giesbergeria sp.]
MGRNIGGKKLAQLVCCPSMGVQVQTATGFHRPVLLKKAGPPVVERSNQARIARRHQDETTRAVNGFGQFLTHRVVVLERGPKADEENLVRHDHASTQLLPWAEEKRKKVCENLLFCVTLATRYCGTFFMSIKNPGYFNWLPTVFECPAGACFMATQEKRHACSAGLASSAFQGHRTNSEAARL